MSNLSINGADWTSFMKQKPAIICNHDGEPDDLFALLIVNAAHQEAIKDQNHTIKIFNTFGNRAILYTQPANPKGLSLTEMECERTARMTTTDKIFKNCISNHPGGLSNKETCPDYVSEVLNDSPAIILHTASFQSLKAIFNDAKANQLKQKIFLTYGSVNLEWAVENKTDCEEYRKFYENIRNSGATFIQVEGFPFLDVRNKITAENTPVTYKLLEELDGPLAHWFLDFSSQAASGVRKNQVEKLANLILETYKITADKEKLLDCLCALLKATDSQCEFSKLQIFIKNEKNEEAKAFLIQSLNRTFSGGNEHDKVSTELDALKAILVSIHKDKTNEVARMFNIYKGTCYKNQLLIADQLPALILAEMLRGKPNGILSQCRPVNFDGLNGTFPKYKDDVRGALFHINLLNNIKTENPKLNDKELENKKKEAIADFLKNIDSLLARSLLANASMITPKKRKEILDSGFFAQLGLQ